MDDKEVPNPLEMTDDEIRQTFGDGAIFPIIEAERAHGTEAVKRIDEVCNLGLSDTMRKFSDTVKTFMPKTNFSSFGLIQSTKRTQGLAHALDQVMPKMRPNPLERWSPQPETLVLGPNPQVVALDGIKEVLISMAADNEGLARRSQALTMAGLVAAAAAAVGGAFSIGLPWYVALSIGGTLLAAICLVYLVTLRKQS